MRAGRKTLKVNAWLKHLEWLGGNVCLRRIVAAECSYLESLESLSAAGISFGLGLAGGVTFFVDNLSGRHILHGLRVATDISGMTGLLNWLVVFVLNEAGHGHRGLHA